MAQAKEDAEHATRLKSDFLNIVSHELRTPLTVMLGNIPFLVRADDLPEPDEIADIARDIQESGQHLLTLINDLLDISKIEAGKLSLNLERVAAKPLVQEVVESVRVLANSKGLDLATDLDDVDLVVDPLRLKQILLNLIGNAIKFTDRGSVHIGVRREDSTACFSVRDTGVGIDPRALPFIFDTFRQADTSASRSAEGSGLGLTISKRLAELHGGSIEVASELGSGSVFVVRVPIEPQAA